MSLPTVEGYRLCRVMGQGGMATVYEAVHDRIGRRVAIKILSREATASEDLVDRFLEEARIANEVRHPNVVDVTDFIDRAHPRQVAYVMELLEGPSLKVLLRRGPLGLNRTLNLIVQVLDALEVLHEHGVIHRDLKPANLMVVAPPSSDFRVLPCVKLLDFGIAKRFDTERTASGVVLGTPAYMAPEQVAGDVVDGSTDIYAIGEILFECLTGRSLFSGAPKEILTRKMSGRSPALEGEDGRLIPANIKTWISRCVADEPAHRPTARELRTALEQEGYKPPAHTLAPHRRELPFAEEPVAKTEHLGSTGSLRVRFGHGRRVALLALTLLGFAAFITVSSFSFGPQTRPVYLRTQPGAQPSGAKTPAPSTAPQSPKVAAGFEAPREANPDQPQDLGALGILSNAPPDNQPPAEDPLSPKSSREGLEGEESGPVDRGLHRPGTDKNSANPEETASMTSMEPPKAKNARLTPSKGSAEPSNTPIRRPRNRKSTRARPVRRPVRDTKRPRSTGKQSSSRPALDKTHIPQW